MTPFQAVPQDFLAAGDVVAGRYRVVRQLGSGGFAQVYLAHHTQVESMRVAIKVLHPNKTNEAALERFRNEARLLAMLQNRHTVRLIDFGVTDESLAYLVMEYVAGAALDQLLRDRGRLHEADVARVAIGVLKSLVEAHSVGVIHRDLKPANIVLVAEPGERYAVPRVLDFGIAKVMGGGSPVEDEVQTDDGTWEPVVYCTPAYAAPELLRGRPDFATDLYALGLVLIELLEGEAPYAYPDPEPSASPHLWEAPVPLGAAVLGSRLCTIVERAVAKELEHRYTTAEEMLHDIERAYDAIRRSGDEESALSVVAPPAAAPAPSADRHPSRAARFVETAVVGLAAEVGARARRLMAASSQTDAAVVPDLAAQVLDGAPAARRGASPAALRGAAPRDPMPAPPAGDDPWDDVPGRRRLPTPIETSKVVEVALFGQRFLSPRATWGSVVIVLVSIAAPVAAAVWAVLTYLRG